MARRQSAHYLGVVQVSVDLKMEQMDKTLVP